MYFIFPMVGLHTGRMAGKLKYSWESSVQCLKPSLTCEKWVGEMKPLGWGGAILLCPLDNKPVILFGST